MKRTSAVFLGIALASCAAPSSEEGDDGGNDDPAGPTNYLIVSADALADAAADIATYRESTGFRVETFSLSELGVSPTDSAGLLTAVHTELEAARAELGDDETLYLLLLGDAGVSDPLPVVPCVEVAECTQAYAAEPFAACCTDNPYGDLDGDHVPEVAVGRLTAHDADDVTTYLTKLAEHESTYQTGLWNRRISLFTGEGGFGEEIDTLIEALVMEGLTEVDHAFDIIGTYDSPSSAFYYTPMLDKVIDLFNDGALMVAYIGHGSKTSTQSFAVTDAWQIDCTKRKPLAFFFTCLNGEFTGQYDGMAEAMVRISTGPVVAFAAAEVSHPYGNAVLAYESQRALMDNRFATVGEAILFMKREAITNDSNYRQTIDLGGLLAGETMDRLEALRLQHLVLYNLIGDPAAAIPYPLSDVEIDPLPASALASGSLTVTGNAPGVGDGTAWVTLEVERNVLVEEPQPVDPSNPDPSTVQFNWHRAVNKAVAAQSVEVSGGEFEATLTFDPETRDCPFYVKVYAEDGTHDSFGYRAVE